MILFGWIPLAIAGLFFLPLRNYLQEILAAGHPVLIAYLLVTALFIFFLKAKGSSRTIFLTGVLCCSIRAAFIYGPYYLSIPKAPLAGAPLYKVIFANKYVENDDTEWIGKVVHQEDPDFFILAETNDEYIDRTPLKNLFPYRISVPDQDVWGMNLFSKYPFLPSTETTVGADVHPVITTAFMIKDEADNPTRLNVIGCHVPPPVNGSSWHQAHLITRRISTPIRHSQEPWLIAGDFNSAPAGNIFQSFLKTARVTDLFWGFGLHPTWNVKMWYLKTTIDHIFGSERVHSVDSRTIEIPGSDHRAVFSSFFISSQSESNS